MVCGGTYVLMLCRLLLMAFIFLYACNGLLHVLFAFLITVTIYRIKSASPAPQSTRLPTYGRYRKSGNPVTEDLLVLLRCPVSFGLGKQQTYTSDELRTWQKHTLKVGGWPKTIRHLHPKKMVFSNEFIKTVVHTQPSEHKRFLLTRDGKIGAYQGLQDTATYSTLSTLISFGKLKYRYIAHMTKRSTAKAIYTRTELKPGRKLSRKLGLLPKGGGWLCGMGRNLHTLGYCQKIGSNIQSTPKLRSMVTHKVAQNASNFNKYECAIGIDLHKLKKCYKHLPFDKVAMENELGTVLIFVDVPYNCLIFGPNGVTESDKFWAR